MGWESINGDNVKECCVIGVGMGVVVEGGEIMGLQQTVLATPNLVYA